MKDHRGNIYTEMNYKGYGIFGEKDIFILFAEMNNIYLKRKLAESDDDYNDQIRDAAINLCYKDDNKYIYPNLVEDVNFKYINKKPKCCPDQGWV